ncbi:MAG: acylphosphatase [Rickettsiales bacterium]|nr:acylphosphatase [Rickettsiales bacterium]
MKSVHVIVTGKVQRVGYRSWCMGQAQALSLNGWVRNRVDGYVEAVFSGEDEAVNKMVAKCKKGPLLAKVQHTKVKEWTQPIENSGFVTLETIL